MPLRSVSTRRILIHERLHGLLQHRNRERRDGHEFFVGRLRFPRTDLQDLPGDAFRIIANALQFEVDFDGRIGKTQMHGHRLLAHQEFQTKPVELLLQLIDVLVAQNDRIGQLPVAFGQRAQAVLQRAVRQRGHFQDLAPNHFAVALEALFKMRSHTLITQFCTRRLLRTYGRCVTFW